MDTRVGWHPSYSVCVCVVCPAQFGNTCYCNSVLQALYYCAPFRERVLECGLGEESASGSLLAHLAELFKGIDLRKKRGSLTLLRKFIYKLRRENGGHGSVCGGGGGGGGGNPLCLPCQCVT